MNPVILLWLSDAAVIIGLIIVITVGLKLHDAEVEIEKKLEEIHRSDDPYGTDDDQRYGQKAQAPPSVGCKVIDGRVHQSR